MSVTKAINTSLSSIDSDFVKALAEPARIEILKLLLVHGASDVKQLADNMPQDRSVISRHLATMQNAGLLQVRKEGRHVVYSIDGQGMLQKSEQLVDVIRECLKLGCC
jgi:DNA-binding transcriptional ArsR family regulator